MAGSQSSIFPVEVGVKQCCVQDQIFFNLFHFAITLVSHRDLQSSDCAGIEHRLVGGLNAALPSLTADGLQRSLDVIQKPTSVQAS